ncbi:MAG: substrate-binding domain-containing protein [Firmicutes bacterium]|nr:substrate-binding domain-containing protein [Bacillota bacterium]
MTKSQKAVLALLPALLGSALSVGGWRIAGSRLPSNARIAARATGRITIDMVTHACPSDSFWPPVFNGAEAAANALGVTLDNIRLTSAQCGSIPAEVSNLETAISNHPTGIITTIPSNTAFSSALNQAKRDGIPVIAMNTAPPESAKNPYLAYVGQSNYSAGVGSGQTAIRMFHLKAGDTVAVVDHEPFNISLTAREKGITAALKPKGIHVVYINTSDNPSTGASIVQAYLTVHPKTSAILDLGTTGTTQVVTALQAIGKLGKIPVGAFDFNSATLHYIEQGVVSYTVDQQPFLQGYDSVEELVLLARYGVDPVSINTGPVFLTHANVKKYGRYAQETGF